jgi:DNA-binding PadR family transcriptional regulator
MKKSSRPAGREDAWIRLPSRTETLILDLLRQGRELYGLELVEASDGRVKRGTVYVTLGRMEEKGYVESRLEAATGAGGLPRRLYRLTPHGRQALAIAALARARLTPAVAR